MNIKKITKDFSILKQLINPKYRPYADQVIELFTQRKIEKKKEAENLLFQLGSRGLGPQSAINKITNKYVKAKTVKGKLTIKQQQQYFVSGTIKSIDIYKEQTTKKGAVIGERQFPRGDIPYATTVKAISKEDAANKYEANAKEFYSSNFPGEDSNTSRIMKFKSALVISVNPESNFKAAKEGTQFMKAALPVDYSFVPADASLLKNTGFCVLDQFLGIYSETIKHLNKDYFINLCYKVRGEIVPEKKEISLVDRGIDSDDDDDERPDAWNIKKGVSPDMLQKICAIMDISHYCYDITKKCFSKYISVNQNYKALIYYCINGHMYWVSDKEEADKLVKRARNADVKIKSNCFKEDDKQTKHNIYNDEILENIPIKDLHKYERGTIIYPKSSINEELDLIIEIYNYIPDIQNHRYVITQIKYKNLVLVIDPNIEQGMNYKDVRTLCNKTDIEFTNQSVSHLIKQLKIRFFDAKPSRHQPTKEERRGLLEDASGCCASCQKMIKKAFDIDHIIPLAEGGTNEPENLQVLCKPCHFEKTKLEHEQGYIRLSQTESCFNSTVKDIFNSTLNTKHAFVEKINEFIPTKLKDNTIHFYDKRRCRKNAMYYNKYDYPLFTVIDEPVIYKGVKATGLYFVKTDNYLPMRGNGWYSLPMIAYCLEEDLIKEHDITHAIYSSLSVPKNHFNKFIDYLYSVMGNSAKLSVNSMIGCFKPKMRENWRSLLITTSPNIAYGHFLDKNGCFIDTRHIGDNTYYQVYDRFFSNNEESEAPIYNQIVEQEAIEVHKLMQIIKGKGGLILDVSTDSVSCVFKTNKSPFEIVDGDCIKGYYDDAENKCPKYRMEDKIGRLKVERMKGYKRTDYYDHIDKLFTITFDNDDFMKLVDDILNGKKSIHINGRAGCGKTTLINMIRLEMIKRGILFISLAPTNKACRLINGETLHRFAAAATGSFIRETKIKYIFIDEVSMMPEMFYKFFIVLKRMRPDIKFIIAGDFAQLLPVKDRIENCNYKDSLALHELCDGNRLELTKCRRSDATLYNLLLPENINKIKKSDFKNEMTNRHICFTNKKRIEINKIMMDKVIREKKVKAFELKGLDYDPNSQDVRLVKGTPIIARKNNKVLNIYNNETFTIRSIRPEFGMMTIEDEGKLQEIPIDEFVKMFNVAYCITCHKSQGSTFDEPYTIHEFNQFDERLKYVALSRSTDKKLINII
jgi:hypothetical protein